jgi:hypothetical protein
MEINKNTQTYTLLLQLEMLLIYPEEHPNFAKNAQMVWTMLNIIFTKFNIEIDTFMNNHKITKQEYQDLIKHTYTAVGLEDIEEEIARSVK